MGSTIVKRPLRWIIKLIVVHPLSSLALVVLLGVGLFFASGRAPQPLAVLAGQNASTSLSVVMMPQGNLPAPSATQDFMAGQSNFNGDLVWNALSDDLHTSLANQGGSKDAVQEQLDQYKQEGREMIAFTYVGGYAPEGGKAYYFYVASIRRPELGGSLDNIFFAFTIDGQGKVASVE